MYFSVLFLIRLDARLSCWFWVGLVQLGPLRSILPKIHFGAFVSLTLYLAFSWAIVRTNFFEVDILFALIVLILSLSDVAVPVGMAYVSEIEPSKKKKDEMLGMVSRTSVSYISPKSLVTSLYIIMWPCGNL